MEPWPRFSSIDSGMLLKCQNFPDPPRQAAVADHASTKPASLLAHHLFTTSDVTYAGPAPEKKCERWGGGSEEAPGHPEAQEPRSAVPSRDSEPAGPGAGPPVPGETGRVGAQVLEPSHV